MSLSEKYTLLRESSLYDRMFYCFHRLGVQSNIIVSAEYSSHDRNLSDDAVYAALAIVIKAHPALCAVGVSLPSSSLGKHSLHHALLHKIDLQKCVVFMDGDEDTGVDPTLLENAHNTWDWTDDEPDTPWWKVLVVGRKHVVFVYHHFVGDGMSGNVFHREFLAALNSLPLESKPAPTQVSLTYPSTVQYPPEPTEYSNVTPSIPRLIYKMIIWYLLRLFFGSKLVFCDLPRPRPYAQSVEAKTVYTNRTITRVSSYRIPSHKMRAVLSACRSNQTTFTPLLFTLLNLTLAADFYPQATFGASRFAFDLRPYLPPAEFGDLVRNNVIMNAAAGSAHIHYMEPFRKAVAKYGGPNGEVGKVSSFRSTVWQLVREHKSKMDGDIYGSIRDWMAGTLIGNTIEDFMTSSMPRLGHFTSDTYLVSNLGPFSSIPKGVATTGDAKETWTIDDMQFSAGATNGNAGSRSVVLNVAGVAGGDTVINVSYEDGIMNKETVDAIVQKAMEKLDWLLD
ncbi:alcohol acetyltransferase [Trichoderma velutinum]